MEKQIETKGKLYEYFWNVLENRFLIIYVNRFSLAHYAHDIQQYPPPPTISNNFEQIV